MAHITPLAFHFTDPTPTNIKDITFGCCDFFKANSPSKWLAEEYIKVDSTFDTYLTTLGRLGKKKSQTAVFCYQLLQHYLSSSGQEQLKLLMQQKSTFLSKEIAKSSTHQAVYNEIHSDNDRKRQLEDVESQSSFDSSQLYSPTHSSVPDSPPPSRRLRRGDTIGPGQSSGSTAGVMHDLLSSDPADDSFVHVDEVHEPEGKMFTYDFLDGDGRYDSNVEEQWIYSNIEIGKALLAFRSRVVGNNFGISQPHEKLALNFIFLIESEFQTGGLQGEVDDDVWVALWESVGELNMPIFASEEIVDAHMWAHLAATCGYDKFIQTLEDSPPASKLLKQGNLVKRNQRY
ncbi:hypothetical protein BGZ58_009670 [Dissophora ornata]|nr:hypothetical protein BGZ58_009670 [Dissophora ornata]